MPRGRAVSSLFFNRAEQREEKESGCSLGDGRTNGD